MTLWIPRVAAAILLAGCSNMTPAQQQATLTAVTQAGLTLGSLAVAHSTTAQKLVGDGMLICQVGSSFVAVAGVNVTGTEKSTMDAACAAVNGVGAALPPGVNPAGLPVATLAPAKPS
jgi:hypothetical protein